MSLQLSPIQVWSGEMTDRPGAAASKLEALARAGADLAFVFTRPVPNAPERFRIFLAPISGPEQVLAAQAAGLAPADDVSMVRVEGDDRPGMGYLLMNQLARANINLQGLSLSAIDNRFVAYLAFDSADLATLALQMMSGMA